MSITLPHSFKDGVDEVASGVQVMDNLNTLKAHIETLEALTAQLHSGIAIGTGLAPPTNEHRQIPGTKIETPSLIGGDVVLIWGLVFLGPSGNTVQAALTINGAENALNSPGSATSLTAPILYRLSGVTGVQTLAVNGWASSAVGTANALLAYQVLNA